MTAMPTVMMCTDKCNFCGREKVFTFCKGCDLPACEDCCRLEIIGSGCGCVWPVYYCLRCIKDPAINPNALLRSTET